MSSKNVYHIQALKEEIFCLYFLGCNFHCSFCIRRKTLFGIHEGKGWKGSFDLEKILRMCEGAKKIVFCGGEPTICKDFYTISKITKRVLGAYNLLLTNAYILPDLTFVDEVCVSIKTVDERLHKALTGAEIERVWANLSSLYKESINLRTETVLVPNYVGKEKVAKTAYMISTLSPTIPLRVDSYIPVPSLPFRRPTVSQVKEAVFAARKYLENVYTIGGEV